MTTPIRFPDENTIKDYLNDSIPTQYKESGINDAIANLAATRFANKVMDKGEVEKIAYRVIEDLSKGKDSVTGNVLTNPGPELHDSIWFLLSIRTQINLLKCAKTYSSS